MSGHYRPAVQVLFYRRNPGGKSLTGPYPLNLPYQISASLTTSNSVGQAQVTVYDPVRQIAQELSPSPMDVITVAANSPYAPNTLPISASVTWKITGSGGQSNPASD